MQLDVIQVQRAIHSAGNRSSSGWGVQRPRRAPCRSWAGTTRSPRSHRTVWAGLCSDSILLMAPRTRFPPQEPKKGTRAGLGVVETRSSLRLGSRGKRGRRGRDCSFIDRASRRCLDTSPVEQSEERSASHRPCMQDKGATSRGDLQRLIRRVGKGKSG